jgi:hypothetical protein
MVAACTNFRRSGRPKLSVSQDRLRRRKNARLSFVLRETAVSFVRAGWSCTLAVIETFWWEVMWGMMREVGRHLGKNIQADLISRVRAPMQTSAQNGATTQFESDTGICTNVERSRYQTTTSSTRLARSTDGSLILTAASLMISAASAAVTAWAPAARV